MVNGVTVWLTGLSGAGKTTLAERLVPELESRGRRVETLDGDVVRTHLSKGLGFSREDRDENIRRIAWVAALGTRHGATMIVSAISPYEDTRAEARERIGDFVEVYVKCSLELLIERDTKGLYKRALAGEIKNFTGVSDPYEEPRDPEIVVETDTESVETCITKILEGLERSGYLTPVEAEAA
jgi:adenylylsulfate kinase